MSDSEDANSRRAARPSTPPFRGPAGPASRPPLTPPAPASGKVPGATPGPGGSRTPVAPFAVPPAGSRGRPATPGRDARKPAPTPSENASGTRAVTPPAGETVPEMPTRPRTPTDSEAAAIPSYGSAPPPSIAATLKSISEFTIVEEPAQADAASPSGEGGRYEPPAVSLRAGELPAEAATSDDVRATAPGHDARWVPAPSHDADTGAGPVEGEAAGEEPLYDNPATELDAVLSAPPFEADHLFDPPARSERGGPPATEGAEADANDDVIAAAFGATAPNIQGGMNDHESAGGQPVYIGGDPSTRFVAESLEEIARGIRAGEISLPPVDSSAEPPAVLAAVLAAILAPRR